jgi:NAD(P)H dehydrogenase (quinone)
MSIAITGGNGELGRGVLSSLLPRTNQLVVATVRDVHAAGDLPVEARPGSFDEPDVLRESLSGVETLFINATFFGGDPSLRRRRVLNAITAATQVGVGQIVLTSWPDLDNCTIAAGRDYKDLEDAVRRAGPDWTILRLGIGLADTFARDVLWAEQDDELVAPAGTGTVAPAAIDDLAEAAAAVVASPTPGAVIELAGPDAVSWDQLASLAGVRYRPVDDETWRERLRARGFPGAAIDGLLDIYRNVRAGWASSPTPELAALIGRPPVSGLDAVAARVTHVRRMLGE